MADRKRAVRVAMLSLAVCGAALLLYAPTLDNPLIIDDHELLRRSTDITEPAGLVTLWTSDYWSGIADDHNLFRPITILTFHIDHRIAGSPAPHVVTRGWSRALNAILLALLGCLLAMQLSRHVAPVAAWIAAVLFVAHPTHHVFVNHLVGRADLLAMLGLLAFVALHRSAVGAGAWGVPRAIAGLLAAVVAYGSKETGCLLAPLLLFASWSAGETTKMRVRTALIAGLPLVLFLAGRFNVIGFGASYSNLEPGAQGTYLLGTTMGERLPAALSILAFYVRQVAWPDASFHHHPDGDAIPGWGDPAAWLGALILLALLGVLYVTLRRRSRLSMPIALLLGQFALTGNLLFILGSTYAGNRFMLPYSMLGAVLLALALHRIPPKAALAAGGLVVPMVYVVLGVNAAWSSYSGAMKYDVDRHPDRLASTNGLGVALIAEGMYTDAALHLEKSIARRDDLQHVRINLALAYQALGRRDDAIEQFEAAVKIDTLDRAARKRRRFLAHVDLARYALQDKDPDKAEAHLDAAAAEVSDHAVYYKLLHARAAVAFGRGQFGEMLDAYDALFEWHPDEPETTRFARDELAGLAKKRFFLRVGHQARLAGRHAEAIKLLQRSASYHPEDRAVLTELAWALKDGGRLEDALLAFDAAIARDERHPDGYVGRGYVLFDLKRYKGALRDLEGVLPLIPPIPQNMELRTQVRKKIVLAKIRIARGQGN